MENALAELPDETRNAVEQELRLLDEISGQIMAIEQRIARIVAVTQSMQLLMTVPGVGKILAITIALETGDVSRFPDGEHFASYAGTVPCVSSSGGKTYFGRVRPDVNHYLKTAFVEAANTICLQQNKMAKRHVGSLYLRMREKKGHAKAIMAVARHLAEASYNMLKKNEPYTERKTQFNKQG